MPMIINDKKLLVERSKSKIVFNKTATIIQVRKLFKGGNYLLLGGFDRGNYSREETIQGRTPIYSRSLERKKVQAFCHLQIFLTDIMTT